MGAYLRRDNRITTTSTASSTSSLASRNARSRRQGRCPEVEQQMLAMGRALDGRAPAAAARRALDGHRADPGRADLRDDRRDRIIARDDDPPRRAERELRPRCILARLRSGTGSVRAVEHGQRVARGSEVQRPTSEHDLLRVIGATALYCCSSGSPRRSPPHGCPIRKGYGEKAGLATGLLLSAVAVVVSLGLPGSRRARSGSGGMLPPRSRRVETDGDGRGRSPPTET